MKVFIGADHRGYTFKQKIIKILEELEQDVIDVGSHNATESCDYPKIAYKVATETVKSKDNRGILLCMTGIGQAIAANKINGARAALCVNAEIAELSRLHNNANILVLGSKTVKMKELKKIVKVWLETKFEGGRHLRRINQIKKIEQGKKV